MILYIHVFILFISIYSVYYIYTVAAAAFEAFNQSAAKSAKIEKSLDRKIIYNSIDEHCMILYDGWFCSARSDSADLCWSMLIYADLLNLCLLPAADRADGALWSALHLAGALSLGMARIGPLLQVLRRLEEWRSNNAPTISSGSLKAWKLCDMWYFVVKLEEWINECSLQFYMQLNSAPIACSMHRNLEQARYIYSLYLITVIGKVAQTAGKTPNIGFHFSWAKPCKDCFPECAKPIK